MNAALQQEACDSVFFQTIHEKWLNDYENLDNNDDNNDDDDNDNEFFEFICDFVDLNTLQLTFSIIQDKWADSDNQNAADISLLIKVNQACEVFETNSLFDEAFILSRNFSISETTSDFHKVSSEILQ